MTTKETADPLYWPYNAVFCCMKFHAEQHFSTYIPLLEGAGGTIISEMDGQLRLAAEQGNIEQLRLLLQQGADVNIQHCSGTPLIRAARRGNLQCVEILLEHDAVIDLVGRHNCRSCTALHAAVSGGHGDVVQCLLDHGADLHVIDDKGSTPLHYAAKYGYLDSVLILLERGARVNDQNDQGETPLLLAVGEGRMDGLRWVLESVLDYYHYRGYCYNANFYPGEAVEFLLRQQDEVNRLDLAVLRFLRTALLKEDVQKIREVLEQKEAGIRKDTVTRMRLDVIKTLLENGADVELQDMQDSCPLHQAVRDKDGTCIKLLLHHGAEINRLGSTYGRIETPLHLATGFYGSEEIVRVLLKSGADANRFNSEKRTPLHIAASEGDPERVRLLLENGADVNVLDAKGKTPLHGVRTQDSAQLLVECGANVRAMSNCGETVLFTAADRTGEGACVKFLINHGADPLAQNDRGTSALDIAINRYHFDDEFWGDDGGVECVRVLLQHGAKLDTSNALTLNDAILRRRLGYALALLHRGNPVDVLSDKCRKTALFTAVETNFPAGINLLLAEGANPNFKCSEMTPLDIALIKGFQNCARILIDAGGRISEAIYSKLHTTRALSQFMQVLKQLSEVNIQDQEGISLIHFLCHSKLESLAYLESLLESGADVDIMDNDGVTGLHIVSLEGHKLGETYTKLLLSAGADPNRQDHDGLSPLHCTAFRGHIKIANLLLEHGADPDLQDVHGRTALHIIAQYLPDSAHFVDKLLQHGATVDKRNNEGWTALHEAANSGNLECMKKLVRHGADMNVSTDDGIIALYMAEKQKHVTCMQWLLDNGAQPNTTEVTHTPTWDLSRLFKSDTQYKVHELYIHEASELSDVEDIFFNYVDLNTVPPECQSDALARS